MQYLSPKYNSISLSWQIMRGGGTESEDLLRSNVKLFLIGCNDYRTLLTCTVGGLGKVTASLPENLPDGVYGFALVWIKNGRNVCRAHKACVFGIDSTLSYAEGQKVTIKLKTASIPCGFDGLDAYEISVLRGKTTLSEEEWLDQCNIVAAEQGSLVFDNYILMTNFFKDKKAANFAVGQIVTLTKRGIPDCYISSVSTETVENPSSLTEDTIRGSLLSAEGLTIGCASGSVVLMAFETEDDNQWLDL